MLLMLAMLAHAGDWDGCQVSPGPDGLSVLNCGECTVLQASMPVAPRQMVAGVARGMGTTCDLDKPETRTVGSRERSLWVGTRDSELRAWFHAEQGSGGLTTLTYFMAPSFETCGSALARVLDQGMPAPKGGGGTVSISGKTVTLPDTCSLRSGPQGGDVSCAGGALMHWVDIPPGASQKEIEANVQAQVDSMAASVGPTAKVSERPCTVVGSATRCKVVESPAGVMWAGHAEKVIVACAQAGGATLPPVCKGVLDGQ